MSSESETKSESVVFNPKLSFQRYRYVSSTLDKVKAGKIVDVGTADCRFLRFMQFHSKTVQDIVAVDLDLHSIQMDFSRVEPLMWDYVRPRPEPFKVELLEGNIFDYDGRLLDADAVVAIEVIEHLQLEDIPKFEHSVFEFIRPKNVIITTPNADFNVCFENLSTSKYHPHRMHQNGFRHYDHKFEWTRLQFESWCKDIKKKYFYDYQIEGVGDPPASHPNVGFCTQIAVFTLSENSTIDASLEIQNEHRLDRVYECVKYVEHPTLCEEVNERAEEIKMFFQDCVNQYFEDTNSNPIYISSNQVLSIKHFYENTEIKEEFQTLTDLITFIKFCSNSILTLKQSSFYFYQEFRTRIIPMPYYDSDDESGYFGNEYSPDDDKENLSEDHPVHDSGTFYQPQSTVSMLPDEIWD